MTRPGGLGRDVVGPGGPAYPQVTGGNVTGKG